MHQIHIRRLHAKYRLPASAVGERRRLDAILASALGDAIEAELANEPLAPREEWCIRQLHVPVQLRLASTDLALATTWGQAVATAIRIARGIQAGTGPGHVGDAPLEVVRYVSREHALLDLACQAVDGDRRRIWAWKQLDLWRTADVVTDSEAVREWVRVLVREPGSIVPILRSLAQARRLGRLAGRVEAGHWISLATSALNHSGVDLSWRDLVREFRHEPAEHRRATTPPGASLPEARPAPEPGTDHSPRGGVDTRPAGTLERHAARIVRESTIGRACPVERLAPGAERAMAALICLDAEPAWSSRPKEAWREFLDRIEDARRRNARSSGSEPGTRSARPTEDPARRASPDPAGQQAAPAPESRSGDTGAPSPGGAPKSGEPTEPADTDEERAREGAQTRTGDVDAASSPELDDGRRRGITRVGGLLFLLNLLPALGIPGRLQHELPERSARWGLHRLGVRLVARGGLEPAVPEEDCALLAFAGLAPGSDVPGADGEAATAGEVDRLEALADDVVRALETRWPEKPPSAVRLLGEICRRDAEIVADPGWIEVRYSLKDVSTDLRRTGLDSNPGFIPWLGVVMRFAYE